MGGGDRPPSGPDPGPDPSDASGPGMPSGGRLVEVQAAALASVSDAVMITARDGEIVWVNEAFTTMSGYSAAEAVGATPRLLNSGEQDAAYYRRLWETILAGRRWRSEVVERHKDGHLYRVVQTITPIRDADGGVRYFVAVHENVTELRSSQAQLQALFDHALDGLLLYDDDARVVAANPAMSTLSGYTRNQIARMTIADVVAEGSLAATRLPGSSCVTGARPGTRCGSCAPTGRRSRSSSSRWATSPPGCICRSSGT